jgi:hypothetical protein
MVIRSATAALLLMAGAGCIIIPIPRSTKAEGVRASIDSSDLGFLRPGTTTRREVLLRLGEPDQTRRTSWSYLCYAASSSRTDVHVALLVPGRAQGVVRDGTRSYLLLRFDDSGTLLISRLKKVSYRLTGPEGSTESANKSMSELVDEWEKNEKEGREDWDDDPPKRARTRYH